MEVSYPARIGGSLTLGLVTARTGIISAIGIMVDVLLFLVDLLVEERFLLLDETD